MFKKDCYKINKKDSGSQCAVGAGHRLGPLGTKVCLCALALLSVTLVNILR